MEKDRKEYIEKLENIVRRIIAPLKDVPPNLLSELFNDEKEITFNQQKKKLGEELKTDVIN